MTTASLKTFAPELSVAFVPRVGLMGLSLAQPYLVNAAINYIDDPNLAKSYGYGLIGAYALTYIGIAVGPPVGSAHKTQCPRLIWKLTSFHS